MTGPRQTRNQQTNKQPKPKSNNNNNRPPSLSYKVVQKVQADLETVINKHINS